MSGALPSSLENFRGSVDIKQLLFVAELRIFARNVQSAGNNNSGSSALLISVGENSQARSSTRTEVNDVGGLEFGGHFPVHSQESDKLDQSGSDGSGVISEIRAVVSIIDWHFQVRSIKFEIRLLKVFFDFWRCWSKQMRVEWRHNRQKSRGEFEFSFAVRNTGLLKPRRCLGLSEVQIETVQRFWWTGDNQISGTVNQGNANLLGLGQMLVGLVDKLGDLFVGEVSDGEHRTWSAFTVFF
ncbi:hypothetical protein OGATHE_001135 [Ogataea polymorpha]|uniref:Uncharacterized protein n=1 Tax=Ogataea polymorpha TaxID=460523 RepID=A0A9P8PR06_9ASCO|nr:hypothetical protein OGATHE_001135 [Ogataea polymorpha]